MKTKAMIGAILSMTDERRTVWANAKLTDDEERAKDVRTGTLAWPRSSSFRRALCSVS